MNRGTEEHRIWLFDLAHGNLKELDIVKGFIGFYALNGYAIGNAVDDVLFRTHYDVWKAKENLMVALENFSEREEWNRSKILK